MTPDSPTPPDDGNSPEIEFNMPPYEIKLSEVNNYLEEARRTQRMLNQTGMPDGLTLDERCRQQISDERLADKLHVITDFVEVKGDAPAIGLSYSQAELLRVTHGIGHRFLSNANTEKMLATITTKREGEEDKKVTVRIVSSPAYNPPNLDTVFISKGLNSQLGENVGKVVIQEIFQDPSTINLDHGL